MLTRSLVYSSTVAILEGLHAPSVRLSLGQKTWLKLSRMHEMPFLQNVCASAGGYANIRRLHQAVEDQHTEWFGSQWMDGAKKADAPEGRVGGQFYVPLLSESCSDQRSPLSRKRCKADAPLLYLLSDLPARPRADLTPAGPDSAFQDGPRASPGRDRPWAAGQRREGDKASGNVRSLPPPLPCFVLRAAGLTRPSLSPCSLRNAIIMNTLASNYPTEIDTNVYRHCLKLGGQSPSNPTWLSSFKS